MKRWSIKKKLISLCAGLLSLFVVVSSIQYYGGKILMRTLTDVSETQLPAVRNMTLVDMMHDGLRAVAFRALFVGTSVDESEKNEVAEELKEFSKAMKEHIETLDGLGVRSETKAAIDEAKPDIDVYLKTSEAIVGLALSGHREMAIAKLGEFQKSFKALEEKLEVLGELIEKDAENTKTDGHKQAEKIKLISALLCLIGLFLGSVLSTLVVRDLLKTLSGVIQQLSHSSQEVSQASSESASSATELSEASTEQAASLQETMASVEEISAMVSQNAESANRVKAAVDTNQRVSEEGSKSVANMLIAIEDIRDTNGKILVQMESSNKEFGEIVKIISEIGEKTKVINDIVFQTKLLSFNASVEAARAGEHGKGFAVVAEEVGNLAQMSGNAAKQITDMLSNSIKKVNDIVTETTHRVDQLVEIGKDKISMGQSTAQKCREALDKISENARTVASMVTEITHASKEQAQGIQEINKAISQLDAVTQQNTSVAQRSSTQAEQLNSEANTLSDAVGELVLFVTGEHQKQNRDAQLNGSSPKPTTSGAGVIHFPPKAPARVKAQMKKVSGGHSEAFPSSSDPNFEEF